MPFLVSQVRCCSRTDAEHQLTSFDMKDRNEGGYDGDCKDANCKTRFSPSYTTCNNYFRKSYSNLIYVSLIIRRSALLFHAHHSQP